MRTKTITQDDYKDYIDPNDQNKTEFMFNKADFIADYHYLLKDTYTSFPEFEKATLDVKDQIQEHLDEVFTDVQDYDKPDYYKIGDVEFKPSQIADSLDPEYNKECFNTWLIMEMEDYNSNEDSIFNDIEISYDELCDLQLKEADQYQDPDGFSVKDAYHNFLDEMDHPSNASEGKVLCYGQEHHPSDVLRYCYPDYLNEIVQDQSKDQINNVTQCIDNHQFDEAKEQGNWLNWQLNSFSPDKYEYDVMVEKMHKEVNNLESIDSNHPVVQTFKQKDAMNEANKLQQDVGLDNINSKPKRRMI